MGRRRRRPAESATPGAAGRSERSLLAPPTKTAPSGRLHQGSLIPLADGGAYPSTEQTLAAASVLLNGGGIGQVQDITVALNTAFGGARKDQLRILFDQLQTFTARVN